LPVRAPLRDVEIDFKHTPFGQHEIHPQRERKLQRLAQETAPRPQEQIFGGLLGNGGHGARRADVVDVLQPLADLLPIDPAMGAEAAVLGGNDGRRQRRRHALDRDEASLDTGARCPAP
jgi:hypothetical protein